MSEFIRIKIGEKDVVKPKAAFKATFKKLQELMIMLEDDPGDILVAAVDNYYLCVKTFEGIGDDNYGL